MNLSVTVSVVYFLLSTFLADTAPTTPPTGPNRVMPTTPLVRAPFFLTEPVVVVICLVFSSVSMFTISDKGIGIFGVPGKTNICLSSSTEIPAPIFLRLHDLMIALYCSLIGFGILES
uniref:Uncharacterized protein n=1 Tax=Streptococcus thermophilus TaxID=1308 RepID=Q8RLB2_STRTR|nr:unknown [Streptococcus thermophilus]